MKGTVCFLWQTIAAVNLIGPILVPPSRALADLNPGVVGCSTFDEGSGTMASNSSGDGHGSAISDGPGAARLAVKDNGRLTTIGVSLDMARVPAATSEGCCLSDESCTDLPGDVCLDIGGTPQGQGTACVGSTIACCVPDGTLEGTCGEVDPLCCDDLGGVASPIGSPVCLGDLDGRGVDEACECPIPVTYSAEGDPLIQKRVKYVAFSLPGGGAWPPWPDDGWPDAVSVTLTASALCPGSVGRHWYVSQPRLVSEISGTSGAAPPLFWVAELQDTPYFTDWSEYTPLVHVYGQEILASSTYQLWLIPLACEELKAPFIPPVDFDTSRWGDVVGNCYPSNAPWCHIYPNGYEDCCSAPQEAVIFTDISAVVDKFKNLPGAPAKSRVDIASSTPCTVDQIVDFVDIPAVVDAFRGIPYSEDCAP